MPQNTITVLDVGHGNCTVVQRGGKTVVIDAGPGSSLLEFLTEQDIKSIDHLLISHADKDHIEGVLALLSSGLIQIKSIRLNSDSHKGSVLWDDLLWTLDAEDRRGAIDFLPALTSSQSGDFDLGDVGIEILGPSNYLASRGPGSRDRAGKKITTNSISATIRITHKGVPLLLLSADLDEVGLDELIYTNAIMTAKTLVFPHHGGLPGSTSAALPFTQKLCSLVNPDTIIFSIGRGKYSTPRPEIVQLVRNAIKNVRIACTQLSEHCAPHLPSATPIHMNSAFANGRDKKACCAGSLLISLNARHAISPQASGHNDFIQKNVPSALCRRP